MSFPPGKTLDFSYKAGQLLAFVIEPPSFWIYSNIITVYIYSNNFDYEVTVTAACSRVLWRNIIFRIFR